MAAKSSLVILFALVIHTAPTVLYRCTDIYVSVKYFLVSVRYAYVCIYIHVPTFIHTYKHTYIHTYINTYVVSSNRKQNALIFQQRCALAKFCKKCLPAFSL